MPSQNKTTQTIVDKLSRSISTDVGNMHEDDLENISSKFDNTLTLALKKFNSTVFDDDGFINKMYKLDLGGENNRNVIKGTLDSIKSDYINIESLQQTDTLLRRDINNICSQMPEMRDVIYLTRDNIVESNTATGELSVTLLFKNIKNTDVYESQVKELEERYNLRAAVKNFIIPSLLMNGEMYVYIIPYAKLFAELEVANSSKDISKTADYSSIFRESIPNHLIESFNKPIKSLYSEENVKYLMESMDTTIKNDISNDYNNSNKRNTDSLTKEYVSNILNNIDIYSGSSVLMSEMGVNGFEEFVHLEYMNDKLKQKINKNDELSKFNSYMESYMNEEVGSSDLFSRIDQENIDLKTYSKIKGCYIKYMDSLKIIPIRLGTRVVGYYYVTTTMDSKNNIGHPNGIVDLSYQQYTRDRNMVDKLASMIIKSFDKKILDKNIQLKNEIVDIIMAHKFTDGKLSFIYIPENEIVRFTIDEDADGKGHSMIEPTIFPARSYLMLNMYNMLYTLNNNTTRIHYLRSSGLHKNYASMIQRAVRKFQSRRITVNDIYSYSGALNKVGGMGEMVLPSGRGDYRAIDTDTIEAAGNPFNIEYMEQQRRQALSGTGAPHLLIINAIDEVDFAKTVELSNSRYQSRCGALKIDVNRGCTKMYQKIMKYSTDMENDIIKSFRFNLNKSKQQDLNITADMITNFTALVDLVMSIYGNKNEWEDDKGNQTNLQKHLRKSLARKYLPQLDHDELDEIMDQVRLSAKNDDLQDIVSGISIDDKDLDEIKK